MKNINSELQRKFSGENSNAVGGNQSVSTEGEDIFDDYNDASSTIKLNRDQSVNYVLR